MNPNTLQTIEKEIRDRYPDGPVPCATAFEIADKLALSPAEIGKAADELTIKINKCQLGLFGYQPQKKIAAPQLLDQPELAQALVEKLSNGRLTCNAAWQLARRFNLTRLALSNHCEAQQIKIINCQLGAF